MSSVTFTNYAALQAGYRLGSIHQRLRDSLQRLSSGNRLVSPEDDPGGAAVAAKLGAELRRSQASQQNVQNALSFLQTQHGIFNIATSVLTRMSELATLAQDVTKSALDLANYNTEFQGLQGQLLQLSSERFNGIPLFVAPPSGNTAASTEEEQLTVFTSADGSQSMNISVAPLATGPWMNMLIRGFVSFADPGDPSRRIFVPNPPQDLHGYLADGSEFDLDASVTITQNWTETFGLSPGWSTRTATIDPHTYTVSGVQTSAATNVTVTATLSSPAATPVGSNTYQLNSPLNSPYVTNPTYRQMAENFRTGNYIDPLHAGTTTSSTVTVNYAPPASYRRLEDSSTTSAISLDVPSESVTVTQILEPWSSNPLSGSAANASGGALTSATAKEMGAVAALALQSLSQMQATNGAQQSRLQFASENLAVYGTNLESAVSRITDVDVATETTQLARLNILQQSAATALAKSSTLHKSLIMRLLVS